MITAITPTTIRAMYLATRPGGKFFLSKTTKCYSGLLVEETQDVVFIMVERRHPEHPVVYNIMHMDRGGFIKKVGSCDGVSDTSGMREFAEGLTEYASTY